MQAIGQNCNMLQYLNLGWCENVGDLGVMSLAYGCPDLRCLDLCGCVRITGIPCVGCLFGIHNVEYHSLGLATFNVIQHIFLVLSSNSLA